MTTRRKFIFQILPAAAAVTALGSRAVAAPMLPRLTQANPAAKALGYADSTKAVDAKKYPKHKPEQDCGNCMHYTAAGAASGTCALFKGFTVEKLGWCNSWIAKR